ncbi:MAG: SDR family NAD(P)-dependent oxidoreductase, partial [Microvirga sp.]
LKGKKVLVTGATKGIGRAIAEAFAAEGADIAICARDAERVGRTVEALKGRGGAVHGGAVDVADPEALARWIAAMAETLGGIDIYVSNVSALGTTNDAETWQRSWEIDMRGTVAGIDLALPFIERSTAGAIVIVNTTGSVQVYGPPTPYPAVKAAMLAHMKYMSAFLAPKNIRINAVSPGSIYFEGGVWDRRRQNEPERYERMLKLNPMGRFGKPEEVASAVVFLASPRSAYTSGTNLVVDGASTTRVQN